MSSSTDSFDPDDMDPPPPAESGSGARNFLLVLIAAAVVPFVLAIGFATKTAVPPPAKLQASEQPPPPVPNKIRHDSIDRELSDHDRSKGDGLVRGGRYETALYFYRSLGNGDSLRMPPELAIRIAICQEGLGLWDEALAGFRTVASLPSSPTSVAAILGQARVWLRLNDFAKAEPLLRCILLQSGDRELAPPEITPQVAALFALTVVEQMIPNDIRVGRGMSPAVENLVDASFEMAIAAADFKVRQTGPLASAPPLPSYSPLAVILEEESEGILNEPNEAGLLTRLVPLSLSNLTYADFLARIAQECGLKLEWQETARNLAAERVLNLQVADLPPTLLLTVACRELDLVWRTENASRTIVIADNLLNSPPLDLSRVMADATLACIIDAFRNPRLEASLKFGSAQIAEVEGRIVDAARIYSSLVGRQASPIAIRAAYQAALAFHQLGDLVQAGKMLEFVVHGAPGHELHTRSVILFGRLLIDQGAFREAAFQLKRAAESRNSPEDQARAAVFCALALLLDGQPNDAGEVLFAHRLQFQDRSLRSAAALMTSLARCRTITDGEARDREGQFLYRSITAVASDSDWLGPSGQLLLGRAMIEAGLDDEMAELFAKAVQRGVPQRVADEMNFQLANYLIDHKLRSEAKSLLSQLYAANGPCWIQAGLRLAELALEEKDGQTCLKICRDIKDESGVARPDLLKLAGRAYELGGNQIQAARCYAGEWPLP